MSQLRRRGSGCPMPRLWQLPLIGRVERAAACSAQTLSGPSIDRAHFPSLAYSPYAALPPCPSLSSLWSLTRKGVSHWSARKRFPLLDMLSECASLFHGPFASAKWRDAPHFKCCATELALPNLAKLLESSEFFRQGFPRTYSQRVVLRFCSLAWRGLACSSKAWT